MRKNNKLWFTLVELLVVITILAIISVVAYQNFGWAVDKAVSGRKISDVSTIETALQQYKSDKNYYPSLDVYDVNTNVWWYDPIKTATPSNKIKIHKNWDEIDIVYTWSCSWGWKVYDSTSTLIWAKWTISQITLTKKYLSKDLYDPELWDIKVWLTKMIDYGVGRYVYAVYKKWWWVSTDYRWTAYNMSYTVKDTATDSYMTMVVWDYDENSCIWTEINCPKTLIWSWGTDVNWYLVNKEESKNLATDKDNQWIPYPVIDFAENP
jgi:prepilin-type N-terminal cleavage/methylation domain-containing protein